MTQNAQHSASAQVAQIERAIANGDLIEAQAAMEDLKPLSVSNKLEDILEMRRRIAGMLTEVKQQRIQHAGELRSMRSAKQAVRQYQAQMPQQ